MEGGFEQRDTEALALARQHERIGERVEVGDDAIRRLHPERVKEMDALDSLRESCELREVEHVRRVVRPRRAGHDEHRRPASSPQGRRRGDGGLDALPTRQPSRQHEQGIGAVQVETLGDAGPGGRHPERGGDVDAVRYHGDGFAFEARQGGELVRALVGDRDIANARVRAGDQSPRVAGMALARVLRIRPREVVRPRDHDTRALAREPHERFGQGQVLVHRHHVVDDDTVGLGDDRSELLHEAFDERVVRLRPLALRERAKITQHALVLRVDLGDADEAHALRRAAASGNDGDVGPGVVKSCRMRAHDLLDTTEDRRSGVVHEDDTRPPARHAVAAALVTRP